MRTAAGRSRRPRRSGWSSPAYWPVLARFRGYVLHLAAGVVFSVVAVELLPEIQRRALVWDVVLGFGLGIATMLAVDKVLDRIRGDDDDDDGEAPAVAGGGTVGLSLLTAVGIDFLLDGLLLGVGFAAGARIGILLALAEAAERSVRSRSPRRCSSSASSAFSSSG